MKLTRRDWQALPELVEDRGARGAAQVEVQARTLGSGAGLRLEASTDAQGSAALALEDPGPRRLRIEASGAPGVRLATFAAWRWGRAEEAWLDRCEKNAEELIISFLRKKGGRRG